MKFFTEPCIHMDNACIHQNRYYSPCILRYMMILNSRLYLEMLTFYIYNEKKGQKIAATN